MNIIAWDKDINAAIEPNRLPVDGEFAQFKNETHTEYKHFYEPVELVDSAIPIIITNVTGALMNSSDFTKITCYENSNIVFSGELAVPDRMYAMPIRRDTGEITLFGVDVVNGAFTVTLNFKTSGVYRYSNDEANKDLPAGTFSIEPISIDVLRSLS